MAAGRRLWEVVLVREAMDCSKSLMGLDREMVGDAAIDEYNFPFRFHGSRDWVCDRDNSI